MKVCVVGSGAREHALVSALQRSAEVMVSPGNAGMPTSTPRSPESIDADLFVIGPEAPLVDGLADRLRSRGHKVVGPGADGARLEGSKAWMKEFFNAAGIPTARHGAFTDVEQATEFLKTLPGGYVVKADGLAAGKGVFVTESLSDAIDDVRAKLDGRAFGEAGRTVVIEEAMDGPELSVLALCDGRRVVPLDPAQDFKRIGDGDEGPNTGGMGAYSPVPTVSADLLDRIRDTVLEPTLAELRRRDIDYRGVLYAGLMLTTEGPKMVEYNVRFGDPESQVLLPRLDSDLADLLRQVADGALRDDPKFRPDAAVTVVAASRGYPGQPRTNDVICGLEEAEEVEGVTVFHAATKRSDDGSLRTAGGRVLSVTGTASTLAAARRRAYEAIEHIAFEGMQYRRDIALDAAEEEIQ